MLKNLRFSNFGKRHPHVIADIVGTKHKHLELEAYVQDTSDFDVSFDISTKGDHPGLKFDITAFFFGFSFSILDDRHWNWSSDRFMTPEEVEQEIKDHDEDAGRKIW
jgi:hypothetical protein